MDVVVDLYRQKGYEIDTTDGGLMARRFGFDRGFDAFFAVAGRDDFMPLFFDDFRQRVQMRVGVVDDQNPDLFDHV